MATVITDPLLKFSYIEFPPAVLQAADLRYDPAIRAFCEDIDLRYRVCLASLSIFPGTQTSSIHRISIERIPRMQMRKIFFTGHSEGKFHEVSRYQVRPPVDSFLLGVHLSPGVCYLFFDFRDRTERKISMRIVR